MSQQESSVKFATIVEELLDVSRPFPPAYLHRFSDISKAELDQVKAAWPNIQPRRRISLMEDLEELLHSNTLVCFDDLSIFALEDDEPRVRAKAISMLWDSNDISIAHRLIKIMKEDPDEIVRAAAASGLGLFIYQGELDEIPVKLFKKVEENLLLVLKSSDKSIVRRKSLEALGFSSHVDVPKFIQEAFNANDLSWKSSALFAMGRSADFRWANQIMKSLRDPEPEILFEAIRSAGELELKSARQILLEMLLEEEVREDDEVTREIIWALSKIGGDHVREALTILQEQMIEEEDIEFMEEAFENLHLTEGLSSLELFDIDFPEDEIDSLSGNLSNDD